MTRIYIILKKTAFAMALFGCLVGCLDKEPHEHQIVERFFGLFVIHLTLLDYDTQEPLPGLSIKTLNVNVHHLNYEDLSNEEGTIRVSLVTAPPTPQQFILSCIDAENDRLFSLDYAVVRFSNPIFVYAPKDAALLGKWYQGTAELTLTHEIRRIVYE